MPIINFAFFLMSCPFAQGAKYYMHGILRNEMKKSVIHEIGYIIVFSLDWLQDRWVFNYLIMSTIQNGTLFW